MGTHEANRMGLWRRTKSSLSSYLPSWCETEAKCVALSLIGDVGLLCRILSSSQSGPELPLLFPFQLFHVARLLDDPPRVTTSLDGYYHYPQRDPLYPEIVNQRDHRPVRRGSATDKNWTHLAGPQHVGGAYRSLSRMVHQIPSNRMYPNTPFHPHHPCLTAIVCSLHQTTHRLYTMDYRRSTCSRPL